MINQNDEDKRFLKMKPEGTVLEDHIGLIAVKMDSGICGPILGNDVFYAVLKRNDIEGCEEFPCHPEFYKKYGCNCCKKHHECIALLKDKCYSQCVKQECQFYPARYYSVSINSSHYNWKCDEGKKSFQCLPDNECEQALCECDRSAAECWVKIPEPMYKEDLCLSVAMDFSRMLSNISFEIVAGVGMKVKQAGEELSLIIKNAKENRKIENLKKANLVVLNAMNTLDEGIRLIEKGEEFMNNTFEVAKLKEEMARKNFELTKTKENIVEEIFSFDMVMLHFIGTKLFAREKNNVLETMKETFKKIEEVEDLIAKL
uniref:Phospholipase A(2) n=1 Tax=Meloidogyne hapla TaxID=6305 RepID=A0A1I8B340_MELHA